MRLRITAGLIALGLLLSFVQRAAAEVRLDFEGGAAILTEDIEIRGEDVDVDVGGSYAIGAGYLLNRWLEVGGQFQQSFSLDLFDDSVDVLSATAGGRVYAPPMARFQPWLVGQIGWYRVNAETDCLFCSSDDELDRDGNSFGFNVGGGFDVFLTDWVSAGVDVRYHRAVDALDGVGFVTTMANVGLHFRREAGQ